MISNTDVAFSVISAQHIIWKKCKVKTHGRPYSALVLRMYSSVRLHFGGRTLESSSGDITYMPANVSYSAEYEEDGEMIFIHFVESVPFFDEVMNFSPIHFDEIYSLFSKIASVCNGKKQNYKMEAASVLMQIVVYLLKLKSNSVVNSSFERALKILKEQYTDSSLTIADVCKKADISDSYLRKLFKNEFGISPIRYLNELRIDHAQKLLYANYCTVENAAEKSGFSDYRYFSRVTKKLRGCTPSKLRDI